MTMDIKNGMKCKSRRERRKEERKLKKMRKDCFKRHKPIPTMESLEAAKLKQREEQLKKRLKVKEKLEKRKERREKEQAMKEAAEESKRQLEIVNRSDMKTLQELEKKLKIRPGRQSLPLAFQRDELDYILNYKEEAEFEQKLLGLKKGKVRKKNAEKTDSNTDDASAESNDDDADSLEREEDMEISKRDSDDSSDDNDNENESHSDEEEEEDPSDEEEEEEEDEEEEMEEEDEEETDALSEDSESTDEDDDNKPRKTNPKESGEVKDVPKSSRSQNESVRIKGEANAGTSGLVKEDIYGRLRDEKGNVVKESSAFVPPGKRSQQQTTQNEGLDALKSQISRIINRLHDRQMQTFSSQMQNLFQVHSRADVSGTLANEMLKDLVRNEPLKRNRAMDSVLLLAVLHSKIGNEVSGVFLESLVLKFNEIFETLKDEDGAKTENQIENAALLLCQLYDFKIIDSHLIFCIMEKLIARFFIKDVHLLVVFWKEVGLSLRKDDSKAFKNVYLRTMEAISKVDKALAHKRMLALQLSDILLAVKNNNPQKLPREDEEGFESRQKLLKTLLTDSVSPPFNISLDDLLNAEQKGKWWLVGSAWNGVDADLNQSQSSNTEKSIVSLKVDGVDLTKLAQKLHINTDVRKKILFAIVSADNYRKAFENVMKLNLPRRQDNEITYVVKILYKKGKGNPFYAHLVEIFQKHHKRFERLLGDLDGRIKKKIGD